MLVDTGVGAMDDDKYSGGGLFDSLRQHVIEPGEVTDVVFTHLHFGRIVWAGHDGSPTFPITEGPNRIAAAFARPDQQRSPHPARTR